MEELAWGVQIILKTKHGQLAVEAFEVKHWGERWSSDKRRGYNGYILRREDRTICSLETLLTHHCFRISDRVAPSTLR